MTDTITLPRRIRRERTKGWRMPPGAIYVGRGSYWGNPYRVGTRDALARVPAVTNHGQLWEYEGRISAAGTRHDYHHADGHSTRCDIRLLTAAEAVVQPGAVRRLRDRQRGHLRGTLRGAAGGGVAAGCGSCDGRRRMVHLPCADEAEPAHPPPPVHHHLS